MAAPVSKQERIRLNQQRSRARKQEYLQDLEKRVLECHKTCREADLQRQSYQHLHSENLKLRQLLGSVGFADADIESYINTDPFDHSAEHTPLRNLRPKLPADAAPAQTVQTVQTGFLAHPDDSHPHTPSSHPDQASSTVTSNSSGRCCPSTCFSSTDVNLESDSSTSTPIFRVQQPQYCDPLHTFFESNSHPTADNSVLCSQARDLIDQYNISGMDIQSISPSLAAGCCPEINPGEGCRVNKRDLFEVLNNISPDLS